LLMHVAPEAPPGAARPARLGRWKVALTPLTQWIPRAVRNFASLANLWW